MFFVDCSAIHEGLLPRLNDIYQELITFVADEARNLASSFTEEMKEIAKVGKDQFLSCADFFCVCVCVNIFQEADDRKFSHSMARTIK